MNKVFVYGTLRSGQCNERLMRRCGNLLGPATVGGVLYDLGAFPGIRLTQKGRVAGEVWEVTDDGLVSLDQYEGVYRGLYERISVPVEGHGEAWVYQINEELLGQDRVSITSGDWSKR